MVKTRLPHRCRSPECQGGTVFTRRLEELLGRQSLLLWEAVRPLLEVREKARREIAGLYRKLLGLARTDVDGRRSMTVPGIGRIERRRFVGIQQRLGVLAAACVDGDAAPRPPAARRFCRPETEAGRGNRPGCAWYPGSGRRARYRRRVSSKPMSSSPGSRARVPSTAPPAWRHRARDSASRNSMPIFSTMARTRSWVSARR